MLLSLSNEEAVSMVTVAGAIVSAVVFLWRVFRMTRKYMLVMEEMKSTIEAVRHEVSYNGGNSVKDMISKLLIASERMEKRQKLIDQRSKAALHYQESCLFETDERGNLTWANAKFYNDTVKYGDISGGLDWITIIHEDERQDFLTEFNSCLALARRIDVDTISVDKRKLRIIGYPYRVDTGQHEGFLIHISIKREK